MNCYATDTQRTIVLGRVGENIVDSIIFPIQKWRDKYGADCTFEVLHQRAQDSAPYVVVNTEEVPDHITVTDTDIIWKLTNQDCQYKGFGKAELFIYPGGGALAKSEIFKTLVEYAFSDDTIVPSPYEDLLENIIENRQAAEAAAESAAESAESILTLEAEAEIDANVGTPSVDVEVSESEGHKLMSFSFHNIKGEQGEIGPKGDCNFATFEIDVQTGELFVNYTKTNDEIRFEINNNGYLEVEIA